MKRILSVLLAAAMILLPGCGSSGSSAEAPPAGSSTEAATPSASGEAAPQELVVWCWDVAIDQLKDAATAYQAQNPNITFQFEMVSSEQIYDKMTPTLATGSGLPDIVALEGEQFARFAQKFPDRFADFTGIVETKDFLPAKVAEVTVNGKLMGLPWDAAPVAMFYRQDIFEQAGVNTDDIKTYDDLIAAGKVVKEKTGMDMLAMNTSYNDAVLRHLIMQQNSFYFDAEGKANMNSPAAVRAMETVKKMYDAGVTVNFNDWSEYISTITQDKAACVLEAVWITGSMKADGAAQSGKWRVRALPEMSSDANGVASNGGSAVAVTSTDAAKKAAAMEFVRFAMTDQTMQVNGFAKWGLYPSYIPAYSDPVFSEPDEYFGGQKIYELFNELSQKIPAVNYTENFNDAKTAAKNAIARACLETAPADQAMNDAQQELSNMLGL